MLRRRLRRQRIAMRRTRRSRVVCAAAVLLAGRLSIGAEGDATMADLVIVNAKVWTGVPGAREAEAIAVTGEVISAIGTTADVRKQAGEKTRVIDAGGRRVIPGIIDTHIHIVSGGMLLSQLDLRLVPDRKAFVAAIAERARSLPKGAWVLGGRWSVESWPDAAPPNRAWIDEFTADHPVYLSRMDGHQALANSAALKLAGITRDGPPDPEGGEIERDPRTGEPTGILKDGAMDLVARRIPPASEDDLLKALVAGMRECNRWGITGVHDLSEPEHLPVYARARKQGLMTLRIHSFLSVSDWDADFRKVKDFPVRDEWLRVAGFKGYVDGSLGSRTAYMREPFDDTGPDAKNPRGLLTAMADPPESFAAMIRRADEAGFQLAVHAIGDEANQQALDHFAGLDAASRRARRHRIEHAQHLLPDDIGRFGELGVVAAMQPLHKADDGRWAEKAIGPQRSKTTYAFRSLIESGARVAFGSDWPVVSNNPFLGIAAAVTGKTEDGKTWVPEQNITVEQALVAYTSTGAWVEHAESRRGTLEPGKLADLVILSQDLLTTPAQQISSTTVTHTICNGRIVWPNP